jgi:GAF domain-containing protein
MAKMAVLEGLTQVAAQLQAGADIETFFQALDHAMAEFFGHKLFTILVCDYERQIMTRVYSTRKDINPIDGQKRITDSRWTRTVLKRGEILRESDLKSVFSEYEVLWGIGCQSVLNIPITKAGVTLGTINLLDVAGKYDEADLDVAVLFAQLAVTVVEQKIIELRG